MARFTFLFAPGAGAPSSHPWMQRWTALLRQVGKVGTLDYPYMLEGRGRPDSLPQLIAAHKRALDELKKKVRGQIILIGKSMGGRVGCHVSLETKVRAVVCFGYPLCGGGDPSKLRDVVLLEMKTPVLFVQGTRDSLCPLPLLKKVRRRMRAPNDLKVVLDGDHSLDVTKRQLKLTNETQDDVDARILASIRDFVASQ